MVLPPTSVAIGTMPILSWAYNPDGIENDYAYVDRLKLNWDTLFVDHTDAMLAASTPNGFAQLSSVNARHV